MRNLRLVGLDLYYAGSKLAELQDSAVVRQFRFDLDATREDSVPVKRIDAFLDEYRNGTKSADELVNAMIDWMEERKHG